MSKFIGIRAGLNPQEKKQHAFYTILSVLLFLVGSVTFFEALYEFCNMVGAIVSGCPSQAIVELKRVLPLQLTAATEVYLAVWTFNAYRTGEQGKRVRSFRRNGIITMVLGALITCYVIAGLITGQYARLVEGFPSPLFPLDAAIGGLLLVGAGFLAGQYAKVVESSPVYVSCGVRGGFKLFHVISYLIALHSAAACVYGLYVMDWSHGMVAYNIVLWLNYFTAFAMAICYRFVYAETAAADKKKTGRNLAICFLVVNVILFVLYIVIGNRYNEAPNLNAYGILPVEFTSSFNAFLVLMGLNNIVAPLVATLKGLFKKKA